MPKIGSQHGHSLVEIVVVIIILGVISVIAVGSLRSSGETARVERTEQKLDRLAKAIAGDPALVSSGVRTDYGYVGDVGALPPNMDVLGSNSLGYATWQGPYIFDEISEGGTADDYQRDAWGVQITRAGTLLISGGSGSNLSRPIANSVDDLLYNRVSVVVTDLNGTPPGETYDDSLLIVLDHPNGGGGVSIRQINPAPDGMAEFDSIPIGLHRLRLVYVPDNDTLESRVAVNPGDHAYAEAHWWQDLW